MNSSGISNGYFACGAALAIDRNKNLPAELIESELFGYTKGALPATGP
jgi:hypothetical protein